MINISIISTEPEVYEELFSKFLNKNSFGQISFNKLDPSRRFTESIISKLSSTNVIIYAGNNDIPPENLGFSYSATENIQYVNERSMLFDYRRAANSIILSIGRGFAPTVKSIINASLSKLDTADLTSKPVIDKESSRIYGIVSNSLYKCQTQTSSELISLALSKEDRKIYNEAILYYHSRYKFLAVNWNPTSDNASLASKDLYQIYLEKYFIPHLRGL